MDHCLKILLLQRDFKTHTCQAELTSKFHFELLVPLETPVHKEKSFHCAYDKDDSFTMTVISEPQLVLEDATL